MNTGAIHHHAIVSTSKGEVYGVAFESLYSDDVQLRFAPSPNVPPPIRAV